MKLSGLMYIVPLKHMPRLHWKIDHNFYSVFTRIYYTADGMGSPELLVPHRQHSEEKRDPVGDPFAQMFSLVFIHISHFQAAITRVALRGTVYKFKKISGNVNTGLGVYRGCNEILSHKF